MNEVLKNHVQQIVIKTKKKRCFDIYIECRDKNKFAWWAHAYDPVIKYSKGAISQNIYSDSIGTFENICRIINEYVTERNDGDSIESLNNPCNCHLIDDVQQRASIKKLGLSFPVTVNK